jgi:hypothetical protein
VWDLLSSSRVLVTGLARDCGNHLAREILRIERHALKIFTAVDFFIVESDSIDKTEEVLREINSKKRSVQYLSLGKLANEIPGRIDRLRYCRNYYVNFVRQAIGNDKPDFVMVVDFDIKNRAFNLSPLAKLMSENWWEGLFANQKGPYYDIYALRKEGWVEDDCFKRYRELARQMPAKKAKQEAVWSQMRRIPRDKELIEVESAFGGLGVYRRQVFESFDYASLDETSTGESEHISLHKKIVDSDGRLFIVPAMTNFSYSPHNLAAYGIFRGIDLLLKARILRGFRRMLRKLLA